MPARIPERSTGGEIIDGEKIRDSNLRELVVRPDFQPNGSSLNRDGAWLYQSGLLFYIWILVAEVIEGNWPAQNHLPQKAYLGE